MMRKIMMGFLILTIALSLLSSCGAEKADVSKTESAAPVSQPKVSVVAPDGWSTKEDSTALAYYMNGMSSFIVTCDTVPDGVSGPDEYVKYAQEQYKKTFSDANFAETASITVDGVEGRDYSFTYSASGMKMETRVVYLIQDAKAYTLTCGTLDEEFDKTADDFQSMIDSFKLQ